MSPIKGHRSSGGFTLVELLIAMALMLMLMAGVLSAYLFLGRNLTRLANLQQQEIKTGQAMRYFSQDVGTASQLTLATSTIAGGTTTAAQFTLTPPTGPNVTYTYTSAAGKLTRDTGGTAITLLSDITSFSINYFTELQTMSGAAFSPALAAPANALSVKAIEFKFTTSVGTSAAGTLASYSANSPRVVMRNKSPLQ
jgi:prepilin-type N-terminal cleavage/methylation domain-containing protein